MKRKIIVSVLGMTMEVAMMTGCGSGSSSSTKTADSTAVESEEVQVADAEEVDSTDDASDTEEVTDSSDTGVSEEPAEAEPAEETTVEGLDEKPVIYGEETDWSTLGKMYNHFIYDNDGSLGGLNSTDANGNILYDAEPIVRDLYAWYSEGYYIFGDETHSCEDFVYVDVDGERWLQYTITVPEGANGYTGNYLTDYYNKKLVFTYSPDFTKMIYNDVVYTRPAGSKNYESN